MSRSERRQTTSADKAWELYCERGVVLPEFQDEIAARKRLLREWAGIGRGLR